jgi:hypothetical protein
MLPCPGLSDNARFAHAPRKQRLSDGVVDLMGTRVKKVFALQVNLCATGICSQPLRVKQRSRSAGIVMQKHVKFTPKIRVASSVHEFTR